MLCRVVTTVLKIKGGNFLSDVGARKSTNSCHEPGKGILRSKVQGAESEEKKPIPAVEELNFLLTNGGASWDLNRRPHRGER